MCFPTQSRIQIQSPECRVQTRRWLPVEEIITTQMLFLYLTLPYLTNPESRFRVRSPDQALAPTRGKKRITTQIQNPDPSPESRPGPDSPRGKEMITKRSLKGVKKDSRIQSSSPEYRL